MVDTKVLAEVDRQGRWANDAIEILERGQSVSGDPNEIVQGLCRHIHELYFTALLALRHGYPSGARTLLRPTFECLQRAIWLHDDPAAAVKYRQDRTPSISNLRPLIEAKLQGLPPAFATVYDRLELAHAMTHGGQEVVEAQYEGSHVADPDYQVAAARSVQFMAAAAMHLHGLVTLSPSDRDELGRILKQVFT